jgi:hypothetical protein
MGIVLRWVDARVTTGDFFIRTIEDALAASTFRAYRAHLATRAAVAWIDTQGSTLSVALGLPFGAARFNLRIA